jgi:hypothetical protein
MNSEAQEILASRNAALSQMMLERKQIVESTDKIMKQSSGTAKGDVQYQEQVQRRPGCFAFAFGCFGKRRYQRVGDAETRTNGMSASASAPSSKLRLASQSIVVRIEELTAKANDARHQAKVAHQSGNKQLALRQLRRCKQIESQAAALQNASLAVERHADILEDAHLQQEVAAALRSGAQTVKKSQKAFAGVEKAVDDMQEANDLGEDVQTMLQQLADTGSGADAYDEAELMEELELSIKVEEVEQKMVQPSPALHASLAFPSAPDQLPSAESSGVPIGST